MVHKVMAGDLKPPSTPCARNDRIVVDNPQLVNFERGVVHDEGSVNDVARRRSARAIFLKEDAPYRDAGSLR